MIKLIRSFFLLAISTQLIMISAQSKDYTQPFTGLEYTLCGAVAIDNIEELPTDIQYILNAVIKNGLTEFILQLKFVGGEIVPVATCTSKELIIEDRSRLLVPKYNLYFELQDSSLGIEPYAFNFAFDEYGQITRFEWPLEAYNLKSKFLKFGEIKKIAISNAKKKRIKFKEFDYAFDYNEKFNKMCWYFDFVQKSTGDESNGEKECKRLVIDVISGEVLEISDIHIEYITDTFPTSVH